MWVNYHHLYYFKTIAETGSVSKAAQKLSLGQPTLSAQLKQFEESIGVQLFLRQHKKLVLTEQGKVALDYARSIFKLGSEMVEVLNDRLMPLRPTLHIGALDDVPKGVVLKLAQYALGISQCHITLSEGKFNELLRELTSHRVDMVISNFLPNGTTAQGLFAKRILRKTIGFYGSKKFRSLKKKFPQSISRQPIILPTIDSKLRHDLEHWAKIQNITLNTIIETQDIAVKKLMAIHSLGIIPAPSHAVAEQIRANQLIEIGKLPGVYEDLFLITANRKIENPIASKIMLSFEV